MEAKDLEQLIDRQLIAELDKAGLRTPSSYPIPESLERVWDIFVDGQPVGHYSHLEAKSRFGLMNIGAIIAGGQHITIQDVNCGGSVIIPFVIIQNDQVVSLDQLDKRQVYQVYAGLIEQKRDMQGGSVWNVPRGYADKGDSGHQTAARELAEETGLSGKVFLLPGHALNPNSTYFETGKAGGVEIHAINLGPDKAAWQTGQVVLLDNPQPTEIYEKISLCRFFPLAELSQLGDMFSVAAESRLRYYLNLDKKQ